MTRSRRGGIGVIDGDRVDWSDPVGRPARSNDRTLSRRRRIVAATVTGTAIAAQGAVIAALWNPWRYVHLMTSTHDWHPLRVLAGSVVLLGIAGWLGLRRRTAVRAAVAFTVLVLFAIAFVGSVVDLTNDISTRTLGQQRVVAVSADGRYEIVVGHPVGLLDSQDTAILRVRSRSGLLSRESTDLGCVGPAGSVAPELRVTFAGPAEITVSTSDGRAWPASFDPDTLRPTTTFGLPCR
jgi:hypothetical protein